MPKAGTFLPYRPHLRQYIIARHAPLHQHNP
jgi:hypothetical protein